MGIMKEILDFLGRILTWWIVVAPWEQCVRVRLGNRVALLGPGVHFRIPYFDATHVQNTRTRMMHMQAQTVSTRDGKPLTLAGSIRYQITDVLMLYRTLHQAEATVKQHVAGLIAEYVVGQAAGDITPSGLMAHVNANISLEKYGLGSAAFCLTDYCTVRTYRMINDGVGGWNGIQLDTDERPANMPVGTPR